MRAPLLIALTALGPLGCRATVADLPADQAPAAIDLLARQGLAPSVQPRGGRSVVQVPRAAEPAARALLTAAGFPRRPPPRGDRLLLGPTEARLLADRHALDRLEGVLRALPGVLDARVAQVDGRQSAALTVLADPPFDRAAAQALVGAHTQLEVIPFVPSAPPPVQRGRPSLALSVSVGALVLTVLGLLIQVRRLRRALGR